MVSFFKPQISISHFSKMCLIFFTFFYSRRWLSKDIPTNAKLLAGVSGIETNSTTDLKWPVTVFSKRYCLVTELTSECSVKLRAYLSNMFSAERRCRYLLPFASSSQSSWRHACACPSIPIAAAGNCSSVRTLYVWASILNPEIQ